LVQIENLFLKTEYCK